MIVTVAITLIAPIVDHPECKVCKNDTNYHYCHVYIYRC